MTDLQERLTTALVIVGVLLLGLLTGSTWLPLSANSNMPSHSASRPDLADWPRHEMPGDRG
ncbi:MAG TPA: hypothetical protein VNR64_13835 [Vicinamibacterales bacterium]|nr:hypothetical protein [Vicinamibacterales bacterium]